MLGTVNDLKLVIFDSHRDSDIHNYMLHEQFFFSDLSPDYNNELVQNNMAFSLINNTVKIQ